MGGGGESAPVVVKGPSQAQTNYENRANFLGSNPALAQILADYGQGKISLAEAQKAGQEAATFKAKQYDQGGADAYKAAHLVDWQDQLAKSTGYQNYADYQKVKAQRDAMLADPRNANNAAVNWGGWRGDLDLSSLDARARAEYQSQLDAENSEAAKRFQGLGGQFNDLIATDAASANRYATDQIREGEGTKGLFGSGGLQDQAQAGYTGAASELGNIYNKLTNEDTFRLTPEDHSLYGQLSGNIAREFGTQEESLAQALANRGLGAAGSGAANQMYSNAFGNKHEHLAQLQRQVGEDRKNFVMQQIQQQAAMQQNLLGQHGQTALGLGNMFQNALSNQFNRNLSGRQQNMNEMSSAAGMSLAQQQAQQSALNEQFAQQQATKGPDIGASLLNMGMGALGAGLTGGLSTLGGAGALSAMFGKDGAQNILAGGKMATPTPGMAPGSASDAPWNLGNFANRLKS